MIQIQLPNGDRVGIDTDDPQAAAAAGRKIWSDRNPDMAQTDVPGIEPQFSPAAEPTGVTRAGVIGAQGVGRGLAELAGSATETPLRAVNAITSGINAVGGTNIPQMPMPSDAARKTGSALLDAIGPGSVSEETMTFPEKVGYQVGRFGAQTAATAPALVRAAATRAPELAAGALPRTGDSFLRPYMGESVARPLIGDAAAAAGAGTATAAVDETRFKDNPVVQTLAALAGAYGGMTVPQTLERGGRALANAAGRPFGYHIDKTIAPDPTVPLDQQSPVTKAVSDRAAAMVQDEAVNPAAAKTQMEANRVELEGLTPNPPMPSPAALSEDPGLSALERRIAMSNQGEAAARNRDFNSSVRDTVDQTAPVGANPQALVDRVQSVANAREDVAQRAVDKAEGRARGVQIARQDEAGVVEPFAGRGVPASERLDRTVVGQAPDAAAGVDGTGYLGARAEKNRQFDTAPGRNEQVPADEVFDAIDAVRANNNRLRPDAQLPGDLVARLDRLRPVVDPETGANVGGPGTARGADLADTRKFISTAYEQAQRAGNFDLADSLNTLRGAINRAIEEAPGYAEANANYRQFADTYRPSPNEPAAEFTRAIDRDPARGTTPPSETAGRFIQPQAPEKQAALRRLIDASENPAAGQAAAHEYLMSDLQASGVVNRDGVLDSRKLQAWQTKWGNVDDLVPGFQRTLNGMTRTAERGQRLATEAGAEVKIAQKDLKDTQTQTDKGAFGMVLNADPDKAVAAVMSQPTRSGKLLTELIAAAKSDASGNAMNGLKAAVRDYLVDKATTNASQSMAAGDRRGPVSLNKLSNIFNEHERELAQIFSPEEMNTLRAGHRALDLASKAERTRVSSGSDTAEKVSLMDKVLGSGLGKGVEAALRVKYGMLKAGGLISTARRLTSGVTGGPSNDDVLRLVERAAYDPDLMGALLGRKLPVGSPAWNQKMQTLLAVKGGVESSDED